jgi:hypothetical protein
MGRRVRAGRQTALFRFALLVRCIALFIVAVASARVPAGPNFSADGKQILSGSKDKTLPRCDVATGLHRFEGTIIG